MSTDVSSSYAQQLKQLHQTQKGFGVGSVTAKHYPFIARHIEKRAVKAVLDYGCGKGDFLQFMAKNFPDIVAQGYDVASDIHNVLPDRTFDLVVCLDVMEHVEFGCMPAVLDQVRQRTAGLFIVSVANYPAGKTLPDGRNAHITQLPFSSWFGIFSTFFRVDQFLRTAKAEGLFVCSPLALEADWR